MSINGITTSQVLLIHQLRYMNVFTPQEPLYPMKRFFEIFELYSVPIFPTNTPEIIKGEKIGSAKQSVENGDVLLCKINPKINRVWFVKNRTENTMIASSEWIVIRNKFMLTDYLVF